MLEPPYGEIADLLKQGEAVPFIGAGVNFGTRPPKSDWNDTVTSFLPSGAELSAYLAGKSTFPSTLNHERSDLAKVASYFVETSTRTRLRKRLRSIFQREFEPCEIHTCLARIERPLLIVTTNYDDLLERAFRRAARPYDLVIHPTDRKDIGASILWWRHGESDPAAVAANRLYIDLEKTTVIYKMHGSIDRSPRQRDSYVVTEEDYVEFLSRMTGQTAIPMLFMRHFRTRHFLFLGYGLRDWNLRVVLRNLRTLLPAATDPDDDDADTHAVRGAAESDEAEEQRSWAIQYQPSDLETALWNARRVNIYDVDINEFARKLGEGLG